MIKTIFLDLDDVCNGFMEFALHWLGVPVPDGINWGNSLSGIIGNNLTKRQLWEKLDFDFWRSIPKSKEFGWLLGWCIRLVGIESIVILTRVPPSNVANCVAGKVAWIKEHFGKDQNYLIGNCKWPCANNNTLLIDDSEINIDSFRRHGGQAITVPRPWNYLACEDNSERLRLILAEYHYRLSVG